MKQALKRMYGNKCMICSMPWEKFKEMYPNAKDFLLEHRDGDNTNYDFDNCQLSCYSCNKLKTPEIPEENLLTGKSERESITELSAEQRRKKRQLHNAPIEIQKSIDYTPKVRRYVWENHNRLDGLLYSDAINEAAEYSGCDPQTAKRKIDPMVSRAGPFKLVATASDADYLIRRRESYKANPNSETGRMDIALAMELAVKAEDEKQRIQNETTKEIKVMSNQADRITRQRDFLVKALASATGKEYGDILKALKEAGLMSDDFGDDDTPATPNAKVPPGIQ